MQSHPELVDQLAFARENFTPGLERGHDVLTGALEQRGLEARSLEFDAPTIQVDVTALVLVLVAVNLFFAGLHRSRGALFLVVVLAVLCVGVGVGLVPTFGRASLSTIETLVEPRSTPQVEIVLTAHYDTKTEWLDHVDRAILFGAAALLALWAGAAIWTRKRYAVAVAGCAAVALVLSAFQLLSPRFLPGRSPGVADNGAACALLVDLAARVQSEPLRQARVRFLWFAAEEIGTVGSAAYVDTYRPNVPSVVVNLEAIGAGDELVWGPIEWTRSGPRRASAEVVRVLKDAVPEMQAVPYPIWTDAGSFCKAGIPAVTLLTRPMGSVVLRQLHDVRDDLQRYDARGTARTRDALLHLLTQLDRGASGSSL